MAKRSIKNCPDFLACRLCVIYCWKSFNKGYNFASDLISIRGLHTKLREAPKLWESHFWEFRDSYLGVLGQNDIWVFVAWLSTKCTIRREGGTFAQVQAVVSLLNSCLFVARLCTKVVAPLLWPSVGVKPNTWKSWELESSGTPECSELDNKAQNTSPWGVIGVIGKVSKCRCPKWPRIGHLDICSPSYGQKKGRESNWQFDSWPLKVGNRPVPDVRSGSATRRWKALFEGYKIGWDLVAIRGRGEELWLSKVPGVQLGHVRDNFGTPFRESREFVPYSQVRAVVSLVCPNARGLSQHPRVSRMLN
jgi:hypothetical protein